MQYSTQRNNYTCVPVAFLNIYKWAGVRPEGIKSWIKKTACTKAYGSHMGVYGKVFKDIPFVKTRTRNNPTLQQIDSELEKGNVVAVRSRLANGSKHLFLVVNNTRCRYHCINDIAGENKWMSKEGFQKKYLSSEIRGYPKVWFIRKVKS